MQTRLYRMILVLAGALVLLAAGRAEPAKPQPVSNETLIPKPGVNSCLVDPRFRINLDGILGCVVNLGAGLPAEAADAKDANVEPLVNFRKANARIAKTASEEVLFHSLLAREQTVSASFLDTLCANMGKKDQVEVTTTERPSVSLAYADIDIDRIVTTFNKLPTEQHGKLGVIIGLTPCVISTAVYTEKPTSVGGNYFGVKVGKSWLYKAAESRSEFYVVAVYAPVSLLLTLAETKTNPADIDINMLLTEKSIDLSPKVAVGYEAPRGMWQPQ